MNHCIGSCIAHHINLTRFETALIKALDFMSPLMMASVNDLGIVC